MSASVLTTCSIAVQTLRNSPYSLPWLSSVSAVVVATNKYGNSSVSAVGNGATIVTVPDAPVNVATVANSTG
jgi:hypothetical protein